MNASLKKINTANVVDQIIDSLTDSIISGKYPAGTRLPSEYELIEELGVSRNSLREAMKILSAVGIVEIKRGDGTYVCSGIKPSTFDSAIYSIIYSKSSDAELLELRQVIDEDIIRYAMYKITPEELLALKQNLKEFEEALNNADYDRAEKLDYEFHLGLIDACKNSLYIHLMRGLYSIFEKLIIRTIEYDKEQLQVLDYHRAILQCVESKDECKIKRIVDTSLLT